MKEKFATVIEPSSFANSLLREVHCVLGVPVDAVSMQDVLDCVAMANITRAPVLISTLNLNFIAQAATNVEFKESLFSSDLCTADGIAVIFIARLLGIRLGKRVAGSDIFVALKEARRFVEPLKVVFFGGREGVAASASRRLNAETGSLRCVKSIYPGFGGVDDFSRDEFITDINASAADILIAALGAKSGQLWLLRNHNRLQIPVRAHLGATLNFQAGTIKRAPLFLQKMGAEWLWRIKEEPQLAKRYARDGLLLVWLLLTRVLTLSFYVGCLRFAGRLDKHFTVNFSEDESSVTIAFAGAATAQYIEEAIGHFHSALLTKKRIIIDLSNASVTDSRFLGAIMMLRKCVKAEGSSLSLTCHSARMRRLLKLSGAEFLWS